MPSIEINRKTRAESSNVTKKHWRRRDTLPDMPSLSDDGFFAPTTNEEASEHILNRQFKQEMDDQQPSSLLHVQNRKLAELNKLIFSSNDLQKLNERNRELNTVSDSVANALSLYQRILVN